MSATDGFTDLPYSDYPAVDSDERYLYRDIQLDDIPYINQFEALFAAVKSATTDDARTAAWTELEAFQATDNYTNHVEPVLTTAMKFQRLEDCVLACQRFAKRQVQQWIVSETEPEEEAQAVNDIWIQPFTDSDTKYTHYIMHHRTADGYVVMPMYNANFDTKIKTLEEEVTFVRTTVNNTKTTVDNLTTDIKYIKVVSKLPDDAASHLDTLYIIKE